ncbi:MAG: HD domain-containing phosphohydrolase, partial [Anaerolineaceae bacterium]
KWDGSGYPRGLKGEEIPISARLFAVVDVWDALRSHRPYRGPMPDEEVIEWIQNQSGSYFDPKVVALFLATVAKGERES